MRLLLFSFALAVRTVKKSTDREKRDEEVVVVVSHARCTSLIVAASSVFIFLS
jgi:hypothetical protein